VQRSANRCRGSRRVRALTGLLVLCSCLSVAACGGSAPERPKQFGIHVLPSRSRPAGARVARNRPNIVFVLTDDLSTNLVRFMPHVLAMQRHGLTFKNYFVSDSLCCPSRASIFTGNYPHDTHVFSNGPPSGGFAKFEARGEENHTFATALEGSGYLTAMMGKWLNGYLQTSRPVGPQAAFARRFATYIPPGWNEWDVAGWGYPEFNYDLNEAGFVYHFGHRPKDYLTDVLTRKGVDFINAATARHQPFFLELATFAPHEPYTPAPRDRHDFPGLKAPRPPSFDVLPTNAPRWLSAHRRPLTRRQVALINHAFRRRAQSVQAVDRMIGQLESTLRRDGAAANTYIVFSSDNGLHTGEYRLMPGKLTAFDTDIRVPLVVTGPGVPAGQTTDEVAENIDLAPTFSAIGGTTFSADGHSLLPLWRGQKPADWRNAALIEHHGGRQSVLDPDFQQPASGAPTTYEAMRTPDYLFVEYADGEHEFYDLRNDPFELHNIYNSLNSRAHAQLHFELARMENCHNGTACWAATHVAPLPGSW
jgi:N-acetylglucosamine-6-sulfatase